MIALFTDFGLAGPYLGQMQAVLYQDAPGIPVVNLMSDVPAFNIQGAAYLLDALVTDLPAGVIVLGVVDPGVGGARGNAAVRADGRWYVGPDNGLFNEVARRAQDLEWWRITWRPERLSASFHGRDLFAPVAARIARGDAVPGEAVDPEEHLQRDWPEDLYRIIYIDGYGNAVTGVRAASVDAKVIIEIAGKKIAPARTFSDVPEGTAFWYENANGLIEIAINQGNAAESLHLDLTIHFQISGDEPRDQST